MRTVQIGLECLGVCVILTLSIVLLGGCGKKSDDKRDVAAPPSTNTIPDAL